MPTITYNQTQSDAVAHFLAQTAAPAPYTPPAGVPNSARLRAVEEIRPLGQILELHKAGIEASLDQTTARSANLVYAGPTSGAAAAPTFRTLVVADIPTLTSSKISDFASAAAAAAPVQSVAGRTGAVTLTYSDVGGLGTAAQRNVGTSNGNLVEVQPDGKLLSSLLPALAVSETTVVASQAAMLALTAQRGDVAIRTDENKSYILATDDPTQAANWKELLSPTDGVFTFNGRAGAVTLVVTDVQELLAVTDLTTYASVSGTGTVAIRSTITSPSVGHVLTWDGSNWINQAPATISGLTTQKLPVATSPTTLGDSILTQTSTTSIDLVVGAQYRIGSDLGLRREGPGILQVTDGVSGQGGLGVVDAVTNAISNALVVRHNTSGAPAAGFGAGLVFQGESSTAENRDMGRVAAAWSDPTEASRSAYLSLDTVNAAGALTERARLSGDADYSHLLARSGATFTIGAGASRGVVVYANGYYGYGWEFAPRGVSSTDILPLSNNVFDIGSPTRLVRKGFFTDLRINRATQSTVGAAGGASALPATPSAYGTLDWGGTEYVVPLYAKV